MYCSRSFMQRYWNMSCMLLKVYHLCNTLLQYEVVLFFMYNYVKFMTNFKKKNDKSVFKM